MKPLSPTGGEEESEDAEQIIADLKAFAESIRRAEQSYEQNAKNVLSGKTYRSKKKRR